MLTLHIDQALQFLDMLDPGGRHTIASEAPFGGFGGEPKWEGGATFEPSQRRWLIEDITRRQARGSNVYYGVNRPGFVGDQRGNNGKCNAEDVIAIRALAFDIDFTVKKEPELVNALLTFIDETLVGVLRPSLVVDSGGGVQLVYLLRIFVDIPLFRPALSKEQKEKNDQVEINREDITRLAKEFENLLRTKTPSSLPIKIDSMSNLDRVMRLPGTVNYPNAEKLARGQAPALAHIIKDYHTKFDIVALRAKVRFGTEAPTSVRRAAPRVSPPRPNPLWPPYRKAKACCEFIRDQGLADTNGDYALNVLLPLLGAVQDGELTLDEAEDCFTVAVSGGERFGRPGRGPKLFERQWRSHLSSRRTNHRGLGTLFHVCQQHGMKLPWSDAVVWEEDFERQLRELSELKQAIGIEEIFDVKG